MAHLGIKVWCDVDVGFIALAGGGGEFNANGRSSFSFQLGFAVRLKWTMTTQLANDFVSLLLCEVRFKDGTELSIPEGSLLVSRRLERVRGAVAGHRVPGDSCDAL